MGNEYKKSYNIEELQRLVEDGKTRTEIAKELGVSRATVDRGMQQYHLTGIQKRGRRPKYDVEKLRKYVETDKTNQEIAELMGVSKTTVGIWIKESGLLGIRRHGGNNRKTDKEQKVPNVKKLLPPVGINEERHLCKTCQYRASYYDRERGFGCDYWEIEGHSRRCSVENCTVYVKGKKIQKKRKKIM